MKSKLIFIFTFLFSAHILLAQSFSVTNNNDDTIYYNIISSTNQTIEITNSTGGNNLGSNTYKDTLTIPDSITYNDTTYTVTAIGTNAFHNCPNLTSITLPNTIRTIKKHAFNNCTRLTEFTLPTTLDTIYDSAFVNNTNLQILHWNATKIKSYGNYRTWYNTFDLAFVNSPITTIIFGETVREIPPYACCRFQELDSVILGNNITKIKEWAFASCNLIDTITLPQSLTTIEDYAFDYCTSLTSIIIPNSVTTLGECIFRHCTSLNHITLPNNLKVISKGLFIDCSALTHITIPNTVRSIKNMAFYNCSTLQNITLPDSVTQILREAFVGCTQFTEFTLPTALIELEEAFGNNPNLHTIYWNTIRISVNMFGHYSPWTNKIEYPFHNSPIRTITFGENVKSIPNDAFIECTTLDSIIIGSHVDTIRDRSFTDCTNLSYICIKTPTPPIITNSVFTRVANTTPIHVSCIASNQYTTAPHWTRFSNIQSYNNCNQISVASNNNTWGTVSGGGTYLLDSIAVINAIASENYHFSNWNDGNIENPRSIIVTQDSFFIANFALNQYQITCTANNNAWGTITGAQSYAHNENATLHAIPNKGYQFINWNDGNIENPRTIIVTSDSTFTANFAINQYQVSISSSNDTWGSVSGSNTYNYGDTAHLQAQPQIGYHFTSWSDNNTENPRSLIVTCDTNLTAHFSINQYHLTATSNNTIGGSTLGSGTYNHGTIATIQAIASSNYHFVNWNDGNTENPRNITMTQDTIIIANFASSQYQITVTSNNNDWGTVSGSNTYQLGSTAILQATPKEHYHFINWNDFNIENPRNIIVTQDSTFTAIFAINQYQITVVSNNNHWGTVTGGNTYNYNETATLHALAQNGFHFTNWNDGNTENPRIITVTQNATYVANFEKDNNEAIEKPIDDQQPIAYPNPTHKIIHIANGENSIITIYNTIGKCVAQFKNQSTLDISNLKIGLYTLKIETSKGVVLQKIIKN